MARPKNPVPSVVLNTALPSDAMAQLTLHLYSDLEQRVPQGAYAAWIAARIREYFSWQQLDLAPYLGCDGGLHNIHAAAPTIAALRAHLESIK